MKYQIKAAFGEETKTVEISEVGGAHSKMFHVMIDGYYVGRVWNTERYGWRNDINPKSELSSDDIDAILELVK